MTTVEAIAYIRDTARVPGRDPSPGELLVAEIDRLRAREVVLREALEAMLSDCDISHVSDNALAGRHMIEPSNGYGNMLKARVALAATKPEAT